MELDLRRGAKTLAIIQMSSPYTFVGVLEQCSPIGVTLKDALSVWYPVNPGEVLRLTAHFVADGMLNVAVRGKLTFIPMGMVEFMTVLDAESNDDPVTKLYRGFFEQAPEAVQ